MKKTLRDEVLSEVAHILRAERLQRGLSLNLVAERAGLSRPMISFVENETRGPTLDTLLRITEALEIDLIDVLQRAKQTAAKKAK